MTFRPFLRPYAALISSLGSSTRAHWRDNSDSLFLSVWKWTRIRSRLTLQCFGCAAKLPKCELYRHLFILTAVAILLAVQIVVVVVIVVVIAIVVVVVAAVVTVVFGVGIVWYVVICVVAVVVVLSVVLVLVFVIGAIVVKEVVTVVFFSFSFYSLAPFRWELQLHLHWLRLLRAHAPVSLWGFWFKLRPLHCCYE